MSDGPGNGKLVPLPAPRTQADVDRAALLEHGKAIAAVQAQVAEVAYEVGQLREDVGRVAEILAALREEMRRP